MTDTGCGLFIVYIETHREIIVRITIDTEQMTLLDLHLWRTIMGAFEQHAQAQFETDDSDEPEPEAKPEPKSSRRGRSKKSADHLRVVEPEPAAAPEPSPAPEPQLDLIAEQPSGLVTLEDARVAMRSLMEAKGHVACVELLKQFGSTRLNDMDPQHYAAFIQKCGAA